MAWTNTPATTRFGWNGPASGDPFSHADFDTMLGNLDTAIPKGALGFSYAGVHGDIAYTAASNVTVASVTVTIPSGTRNVLVIGRSSPIAALSGNTDGLSYLQLTWTNSGGETLLSRSYREARSDGTGALNDLFYAHWSEEITVHQSPPTGSVTYKLVVKKSGTTSSQTGTIKQTDGSGVYQQYYASWIGVWEL